MSVTDILLGKNPNQLGIYDAQLHSLQILDDPVENDDAVNLAYFNIHDIVPFIEFAGVVNIPPPSTGIAGNVYILESQIVHDPPIPGEPYFRTDYWNCAMAGFRNTFSTIISGALGNTQGCNPVEMTSPLGDGSTVWGIHYKRTYDGGTLGVDSIKAMLVLKSVFIPYNP